MSGRKKSDLVDPSSERGLIGAILLDPSVLSLPETAIIDRKSFHNEFYGLA